MIINYFAKTDIGKERKENQDSYGVRETKNIYFVCDGMGGQAAGDFASKSAVNIVLKSLDELTNEEVKLIIGDSAPQLDPEILRPMASVRLANRLLYNLSEKNSKLAGMGTTFTGIMFETDKSLMHIYHIGDSRIYRIRNGIIEQLTRDHSKINELIELGKMSKEEAKTAEIQSMITRALGIRPNVKIDYRVEQVSGNDYFLICSDGLNSELEDDIISKIFVQDKNDIGNITEDLIKSANDHGGRDNVTVIVLKIDDEGISDKKNKVYSDALIVDEETAEQSLIEDKIINNLIGRFKIEIPKSVREKSLIGSTLFWAIFITIITICITFFITKIPNQKPETELIDLTGQVSGLRVEIRTPNDEQLKLFFEEKDKIQKLQMVQDWYNDKNKYTKILKNVGVLIKKDKEEKFGTIVGSDPIDINLECGRYVVELNYYDFKIISNNLELRNTCNVSVEMASCLKDLVYIMIPSE